MKYLLQGGESSTRFTLLLQLTRITSEPMIDALEDYLCKGLPDVTAAAINSVQLSNFSRALKTLNEVAAIVEQIKNHDWQHLNQLSDKF